MRIFGGDKIGALMNTLNLPDDMPIENSVISKSLESAQKRVEGHNFDIRKHLVEYDDVMNSQREVIYSSRRRYLEGKDLQTDVETMFKEEYSALVAAHTDAKNGAVDLGQLQTVATTINELPTNWSSTLDTKVPELIVEDLLNHTQASITKRQKSRGHDVMALVYRLVLLKTVDSAWLEHLENMDHLRDGIGLRGYGQRDPLVEYKAEAFGMFHRLQAAIRAEIVGTILKVDIQKQPAELQHAETEITEGAEQAIVGMQRVAKKQAVETRTRKITAAVRPNLQPIRKKSKKKPKKRR